MRERCTALARKSAPMEGRMAVTPETRNGAKRSHVVTFGEKHLVKHKSNFFVTYRPARARVNLPARNTGGQIVCTAPQKPNPRRRP